VLSLLVAAGCGMAQRPSVKVVDPELLAHGTAMERERLRGGFALGPYMVRDAGTRSEAPDPDGPLASEDVRRPVTQHRAKLALEASDSGRTWTSTCTLQRRAPEGVDFRAVLDENGDEIAVECTAKPEGAPPWRFEARAVLSRNFVGLLGPEGDEPPWSVEILTRSIVFKRIERLLPVPVAQVRPSAPKATSSRGRKGEPSAPKATSSRGRKGEPSAPKATSSRGRKGEPSAPKAERRNDRKAVLAVLLGRPERAWVAETLDPLATEAALAILLTLGLLPWELAE
jgi:hypothetical protein